MKCFNQVIIVVLALGLSSKVQAWGIVGHHASAQIAYDILKAQNSPALREIHKILKADDFVEASTWADEIRGSSNEWKNTIWFHFEKMNDSDRYLPHLKKQSAEDRVRGGTVQALLASEVLLLDKRSSADDRKHALKFIIHFIGDMHQPLHTGRVDDNGGNKVIVKWLGFNMNLHQIWDSQIIALGHKNLFAHGDRVEQITRYAHYLQQKYKTLKLPDQNTLKYDDWIHESMQPRFNAYKYKDEGAQKYTKRFLDTVDQRVYIAGVRIAFTMNRLFPGYKGKQMATPKGQKKVDALKNDITRIIGDFTQFLDLKP